MLALFILTYILEAILYSFRPLWTVRRYVTLVIAPIIAFVSAWFITHDPGLVSFAVGFISLFRVINAMRVAQSRMHAHYLLAATRRTALILVSLQIGIIGFYMFQPQPDITVMLQGLVWLQLLCAGIIFAITLRNIYKSRHLPHAEYYSDKELPTVSVLIPARNETGDLEDCLRSLIASDYPKLEIIVLDDCSQDKTPDIIKGFAQKGVRFIKGADPDEHWLAKNQAYERLRQEASGELLLFCGVDVRFGAHSVRALVTTLKNRNKSMISVMPRRLDSTALAAFVQPMRYWWELALPRRIFNRPPVLSTCWLIHSDALSKLGGFGAVSRSIIPEAFFARELVKKDDSYSFVRTDTILDIQTVKNVNEQLATATRVRYPQLRRRPENMLIISVLELVFLLLPFVLLALPPLYPLPVSAIPIAFTCLLLTITHFLIVSISNPANVPLALINLPVVVLTELYLGYSSMFRYEFGRVDWKDRNICIPIMHVIPRLPSVDEGKLQTSNIKVQ